jgi:hypothetical protein
MFSCVAQSAVSSHLYSLSIDPATHRQCSSVTLYCHQLRIHRHPSPKAEDLLLHLSLRVLLFVIPKGSASAVAVVLAVASR